MRGQMIDGAWVTASPSYDDSSLDIMATQGVSWNRGDGKMSLEFEWFNPAVGTPIVAVGEYGLGFNKAAIEALGTPAKVRVGFNKEKRIIAVMPTSEDDVAESLRQEYYRLMFTGSKYLTPQGFQDVFRGIQFEPKGYLNEGLQAVDFIANAVSRSLCSHKPYKPIGFKESPFPDILASKIYTGPTGEHPEFGVKRLY